jgi:sporulation protein YlmC with PRC-barrel domain
MLRNINELIGYNVLANDGRIGHVEDFYFNDEHWIIRYLIVDTGIWIFGRKVLISPSFFIKEPDWINNIFPINLTKKQIKESPEISTDKPVSRQKEIEIAKYYNLPVYWGTGDPAFFPYTIPYETVNSEDLLSEEESEKENFDSHLRSINELEGYCIKTNNKEIGHVEDFVFDDDSWEIKYLVIGMKKIFPGKKILINISWIKIISWLESTIYINHTVDEIKNCPEYYHDKRIDREYCAK